jgi:hypothetical protein
MLTSVFSMRVVVVDTAILLFARAQCRDQMCAGTYRRLWPHRIVRSFAAVSSVADDRAIRTMISLGLNHMANYGEIADNRCRKIFGGR